MTWSRVSGIRTASVAAPLVLICIIGLPGTKAAESVHEISHRQSIPMCDTCGWSNPDPVLPDHGGRPRALRFASASFGPYGSVVVGNRIPNLFDLQSDDVGSLELVAEDSLLRAPPETGMLPVHPRVAVDDSNTVHLLWGEGRKSQTASISNWLIPAVDGIWTTRHSAGAGWSAPEQVMAGPNSWRKDKIDELAIDGLRVGLAITPPLGSPPGVRITALLYDSGGWRTVSVPGTARAAYASLALNANRVVIAFVAGSGETGVDVNSVYVVESSDFGVTWSDAHLLQGSHGNPSFRPRIRFIDRTRIVVGWTQKYSDGSSRLVVARLSNELSAPPTFQDISLDGPAQGIQAVVDGFGRAHFAFENYDPRTSEGSLVHAISTPEDLTYARIFTDLRAIDPAVHRTDSGGVRLTFLAQSRDAAPGTDYASFSSDWRGK